MFEAFGTKYDGGISSMLLHFGQSSLGIKKSKDEEEKQITTDLAENKEQKPKWSLKDMLLQGFK